MSWPAFSNMFIAAGQVRAIFTLPLGSDPMGEVQGGMLCLKGACQRAKIRSEPSEQLRLHFIRDTSSNEIAELATRLNGVEFYLDPRASSLAEGSVILVMLVRESKWHKAATKGMDALVFKHLKWSRPTRELGIVVGKSGRNCSRDISNRHCGKKLPYSNEAAAGKGHP